MELSLLVSGAFPSHEKPRAQPPSQRVVLFWDSRGPFVRLRGLGTPGANVSPWFISEAGWDAPAAGRLANTQSNTPLFHSRPGLNHQRGPAGNCSQERGDLDIFWRERGKGTSAGIQDEPS